MRFHRRIPTHTDDAMRWAFRAFLALAVIIALHNQRENSIKGCERSQQFRDAPMQAFAQAAADKNRKVYERDGDAAELQAAKIYQNSSDKLTYLVQRNCRDLYPSSIFGI